MSNIHYAHQSMDIMRQATRQHLKLCIFVCIVNIWLICSNICSHKCFMSISIMRFQTQDNNLFWPILIFKIFQSNNFIKMNPYTSTLPILNKLGIVNSYNVIMRQTLCPTHNNVGKCKDHPYRFNVHFRVLYILIIHFGPYLYKYSFSVRIDLHVQTVTNVLILKIYNTPEFMTQT